MICACRFFCPLSYGGRGRLVLTLVSVLFVARFDVEFPEPMLIAVGIDGYRFVTRVELNGRLGTRFEVLDLAAMLRLQTDEQDGVLLRHRVWLLANLDGYGSLLATLDCRNVVLDLAVRGPRFEFLHLLAAADGCDS